MLIALVGDIHGCVLHMLGALAGWQRTSGKRLDCIIQVGDVHAYPEETYPKDDWYVVGNPAELDALRVQNPSAEVRRGLELAQAELRSPVYFINGNHEDFDWLARRHLGAGEDEVAIDPCGMILHLEDGTILEQSGVRIACLGKIDLPGHYSDLDDEAYERLMALDPGSVDILVTHDNPRGIPPGYMERQRGVETGGSPRVTALVERLAPWLHIGGHIHQAHGPRRYGNTVSYTLNMLVPPKRDRWAAGEGNPAQQVAPRSIAIVDSEARTFGFAEDDWLREVAGDQFDLAGYLA